MVFSERMQLCEKTKTFCEITTYVGKNQGEKFAKEFFEKCLKIVPPTLKIVPQTQTKKVFPVTKNHALVENCTISSTIWTKKRRKFARGKRKLMSQPTN